ncbi:hypothetical protein [Silvibacterium sp.]|uniref:M61 family metallopeptidase n=1 Tax=Silvibacterium sp. TaxID=1964179 RepID=UPI0039E68C4F
MIRSCLPGLCLLFMSAATPVVLAQSSSQSVASQSAAPIQVTVDVTDAPRKIYHAHLVIPVHPGPLTLLYPKWIPGEHSPSGPIESLTGLIIRAGGGEGSPLAWSRDDVNMFAFHLTVPAGVTSLDVHDDFLATAAPSGDSSGASTSANIAVLNWNEILLYPAGTQASQLMLTPAIKLPADWQYGSALTKTGEGDGVVHFAPVTLEQLIDSPLLAGRYFAEFPLAPEVTPKHYLDLAADGPEDLKIKPEALAAYDNLIRETGALYRSRHYDSYHFLVTLSDHVGVAGIEHHQSSDDRVGEKTFLDDNLALMNADLLPHEFTHSWNGKYRACHRELRRSDEG